MNNNVVKKEVTLPYKFIARDYQRKLSNSIKVGYKRCIAVWHRRAGKDKTCINVMAEQACQVVGSYYYFLPTYAQGKKIIWDGMDKAGFKFLDHFPPEMIVGKNSTEMKLTLRNNSIFQVVGTDKFDAIMGTNPIGCVFSEYSIQNPMAWQYIRPILVENSGWAIFPYTPRGMTHGYELYNTAKKNPHIWFSELLTIRDTGAVTEEDIEQERAGGMPEDLIEQEFFCSWNASQSRQFIPFSLVNAAVSRELKYPNYQYAPVIMGVDIARFGDDKSVICVRKGLKILEIKKYQKFNTIEMARHIAVTQDEHEVGYTYIDVGNMGAGVVDHLKTAMGRHCTEANSGEKADDKAKYFNKRAEMWGRMRDWLKNADIPDDTELIADLTNPEYDPNGKGQIVIETKKHMKGKQRNLPSPDVAEALLQTFYEEIMGDDDDFDVTEERERNKYSKGEDRRANVDETGY